MAGRPDYLLFDADNHYYEPRDCFTRYLPREQHGRAIRVVEEGKHGAKMLVGDRPFTFLSNLFHDQVPRAGSLKEMLKMMRTPDYEGQVLEPVRPEFVSREARLKVMDEQGVEACFMFPTLGVCVEHFMKDDPDQLYLNLHAFNRWLLEEWGFGRDGRIYGVPLLSLCDLDRALEELDWVMAEGARVVGLRPGPAYGRSPADPYFDPFWARINEAKLAVAFHVGESGYNESMSVLWGEEANPSSHRQSAFQWSNFYCDRPIMDTLSALIFHNLFGRFPDVNVVSVENGSGWVAYLMKCMDKMGGMGLNGPWIGGRIKTRPSKIFKRHVHVSPFYEDDVEELAATLGDDRVVFGSDYPHPEGLAEPASFLDEISNLAPNQVRRIMRENSAGLVGTG